MLSSLLSLVMKFLVSLLFSIISDNWWYLKVSRNYNGRSQGCELTARKHNWLVSFVIKLPTLSPCCTALRLSKHSRYCMPSRIPAERIYSASPGQWNNDSQIYFSRIYMYGDDGDIRVCSTHVKIIDAVFSSRDAEIENLYNPVLLN